MLKFMICKNQPYPRLFSPQQWSHKLILFVSTFEKVVYMVSGATIVLYYDYLDSTSFTHTCIQPTFSCTNLICPLVPISTLHLNIIWWEKHMIPRAMCEKSMALIQCPKLDTSALTPHCKYWKCKIDDTPWVTCDTFHGYLSSTAFCTCIHKSVASDSRGLEQLTMARMPFSVEFVMMWSFF
jgi:hypothetical protein